MANSWFRLYHDMPNDPKFKTIARVSKQPISVVLGVYVHLLVSASAAVDRGTLDGYNVEDLATALDVDSASVGSILDAMQGRVLEGDKVSGWEKRQVNREDSSTERVKRYRERKVTQRNAVKHNVTADKKREEERKEVQKPLASTAVAVTAKLVCTLPLNDNSEHEVFDMDLRQWQELYLAVDVRQELRNLKGWLIGNPKLRKTKSGINRFINSWMSREQNKAKPTGGGNGFRDNSKTGGNIDAAAAAYAILAKADRDSRTADEVLDSEGGAAEPGSLGHLLAGSIELRDH